MVALLCLAGAVAWTGFAAQASLQREAATSADRIAAQLARQPGLGSAGPVAMSAAPPQPAPALLPGICADIQLGVELPRRVCGDWDGLDAAPAWFRDAVTGDAAAAPTIRAIVFRERTIGSVTAWPDPVAAAARVWQRVRFAGGLALALTAATLLLNWLAVTRIVAPAGQIVLGLAELDAARTRSPLPRFAAAEAYRQYKAHGPDLVILDLSLPGPSGIEAIRHIRQWDGAARILVLSMRTGAVVARQAFAAGACGYVSKASPPRALLAAVAAVLRGERAMSDDIAHAIAQDEVAGGRAAVDALSPREVEILSLIAGGMTAQAAAEALCVSLKTVHNNLSGIRAKLGARTDAHLVRIAAGAGLVTLPEEPAGRA